MRLLSLIVLAAFCLGSVSCLTTASNSASGDQAVMDRYAQGFTDRKKAFKNSGFRWPNGKGYSDDEKVVEISRVDSRTSAFGKREIRCRLTIETSRWEVVDGKRLGTPKVSKRTEDRWLPAE
ncbi:MAG: hypothetical protein EOP87_17180 [Verrucomicrobiaceae bacterium]|nr:MAG: hypothetical protein EOP87_17180 [Verrucomicrobiaceae bacterium]